MIYFDSCYLAKLYLMEPDSARVRARAEASDGLACSATGRGEVVATFHRHFREKRLTQREFRQLAAQVEADLDAGLWTALPVTTALLDAQARRIATLPANVFLRAADALHLECAAQAGLHEVYSGDRHLVAAAPHFRLRAVTL